MPQLNDRSTDSRNCNFTEFQHRPTERAKASKGGGNGGHGLSRTVRQNRSYAVCRSAYSGLGALRLLSRLSERIANFRRSPRVVEVAPNPALPTPVVPEADSRSSQLMPTHVVLFGLAILVIATILWNTWSFSRRVLTAISPTHLVSSNASDVLRRKLGAACQSRRRS